MSGLPSVFKLWPDSSTARRADLKGLRNFGSVTPWLFRSGQPTSEGVESLARMGVRTVVSLRWGQRSIGAERDSVVKNGMKFISFRTNYWSFPDAEFVNQFFKILENKENHPILVHCLHGADRTGMLLAMFRITKMGWSFQQAYDEMKDFGFHRFGLRHFKWAVYHYSQQHKIDTQQRIY